MPHTMLMMTMKSGGSSSRFTFSWGSCSTCCLGDARDTRCQPPAASWVHKTAHIDAARAARPRSAGVATRTSGLLGSSVSPDARKGFPRAMVTRRNFVRRVRQRAPWVCVEYKILFDAVKMAEFFGLTNAQRRQDV